MKRGAADESLRASLRRLTAVFTAWSYSTSMPVGHNRARSSSRVTSSPARSTSIARTRNDWWGKRTRRPDLYNSSVRRSASNPPNRMRPEADFCEVIQIRRL